MQVNKACTFWFNIVIRFWNFFIVLIDFGTLDNMKWLYGWSEMKQKDSIPLTLLLKIKRKSKNHLQKWLLGACNEFESRKKNRLLWSNHYQDCTLALVRAILIPIAVVDNIPNIRNFKCYLRCRIAQKIGANQSNKETSKVEKEIISKIWRCL